MARIISNELLYTYLLTKINPDENPDVILHNPETTKDIFWTDSKNALIELVYALHASGVISHVKIGIRKISLMFQTLGFLYARSSTLGPYRITSLRSVIL